MSLEAGDSTHSLSEIRRVTIDALCEHFANDAMTVEEFESRVDRAHAATRVEALKELLRDLPGGAVPVVASPPSALESPRSYSVDATGSGGERSFAVAVLGGTRRVGRWAPARHNYAVSVMGGVELDFREAMMPLGVTELHVYTLWGGVQIIVPPGVNVVSHGIGILGGFDHHADAARVTDPEAPTLRVTGLAVMGGVEVSVRHPGESARDARRRRRQERRALRREQRRRLGP